MCTRACIEGTHVVLAWRNFILFYFTLCPVPNPTALFITCVSLPHDDLSHLLPGLLQCPPLFYCLSTSQISVAVSSSYSWLCQLIPACLLLISNPHAPPIPIDSFTWSPLPTFVRPCPSVSFKKFCFWPKWRSSFRRFCQIWL